jgi:hypothetical protein
MATNFTASALFCWMLKASVLAEITGAHIPAARVPEITNAINLAIGKAFPVVLATGVVIAIVDFRRILRVSQASVQLQGAASAPVV